jgi:predicted ester cyclase
MIGAQKPLAQEEQAMTTTIQPSDQQVATRVYEAFDAGDVAAVDELFSAHLIDHNPVPGAATAIGGMRALVTAVRDGFTAPRHEILHQARTDDGWIVTHWRMTGRHTGDWFGVPASGRDVSFTGTDLVRIVDGRITEIRHVEELLQLQAQITG